MTPRQLELVRKLRQELLRVNYPGIFAVDNETLEAVERAIELDLEGKGKPPILECGKNGLWFKGCELVLLVK